MDIEKNFAVKSFTEAFDAQMGMIGDFDKYLTEGGNVDVVFTDARTKARRSVMEYSLSYDRSIVKIDHIWVEPEYRGIGFGKSFFRILESAARIGGASGISYYPSFLTGEKLIDFLDRRGYVKEGKCYI